MLRLYTIAGALLLASAMSASAVTLDVTRPLKNEMGAPSRDCSEISPDGKSCVSYIDVTIGYAIAHALFMQFDDERSLSGDQKWARGELAWRIQHAKQSIDLTAEDVVVIKRCVGKAYPPLVVQQVFPLLDPTAQPPKVQ